jgi:hypothetical protein
VTELIVLYKTPKKTPKDPQRFEKYYREAMGR